MICDSCKHQIHSVEDRDYFCKKGHWEGGYYLSVCDDEYDLWAGCIDYEEELLCPDRGK